MKKVLKRIKKELRKLWHRWILKHHDFKASYNGVAVYACIHAAVSQKRIFDNAKVLIEAGDLVQGTLQRD